MGSTRNESLNPIEKEDYRSILCLLHAKVHGDPLPNDTPLVVHECDLYGNKNPCEIWEAFGGGNDGSNHLYLFTIIKMNMNSGDVFRNIGSGSWQDQRNDVAVVCKDTGQHLAVKKSLLFINGGTSHHNHHHNDNNHDVWIMHEYRLVSFDFLGRASPNFLRSSSANFSYVLCKLMKLQRNHVQIRMADERIARQVQVIIRPRANQSTTRPSQMPIATPFNNNNSGGLRPMTMSRNMQLQVKEMLMRASRWNNGTAEEKEEEEEERRHQ